MTVFDSLDEVREAIEALIALIAIADAMYAEHAAKEQAKSDAEYMAEFGHTGPRIASPLNSEGRRYVYQRHQINRRYSDLLPDAMTALGQKKG